MTNFEEGLDRVTYVVGALEYERPLLGSSAPLPGPAPSRVSPSCSELREVCPAFPCRPGRAFTAPLLCSRREVSTGGPTGRCAGKRQSSRRGELVTYSRQEQNSSEVVVAVVQFGGRQDPFPLGLREGRQASNRYREPRGSRDPRVNGSILNKLMCTRCPVSAISMELAVHMKAMGQKAAVNWTPRAANREADALANGKSSGFDPAKRSRWRILPQGSADGT